VAVPSASLDVYLSHLVGDQISNDHWNLNDACSPSQPRPPQTPNRCNSVDNVAKNGILKADLNNKGDADLSCCLDFSSKQINAWCLCLGC